VCVALGRDGSAAAGVDKVFVGFVLLCVWALFLPNDPLCGGDQERLALANVTFSKR